MDQFPEKKEKGEEGWGEKNVTLIRKCIHQNPMKQMPLNFTKNNYITYIHHSCVYILKVPSSDPFCNRILKYETISPSKCNNKKIAF